MLRSYYKFSIIILGIIFFILLSNTAYGKIRLENDTFLPPDPRTDAFSFITQANADLANGQSKIFQARQELKQAKKELNNTRSSFQEFNENYKKANSKLVKTRTELSKLEQRSSKYINNYINVTYYSSISQLNNNNNETQTLSMVGDNTSPTQSVFVYSVAKSLMGNYQNIINNTRKEANIIREKRSNLASQEEERRSLMLAHKVNLQQEKRAFKSIKRTTDLLEKEQKQQERKYAKYRKLFKKNGLGAYSPTLNNSVALDKNNLAVASKDAPPVIKSIVQAGNIIAKLPYVWGGGHGSFQAKGYDCSGSVSYALAAGGLVNRTMVSGEFEKWGEPGPGKWITVYANSGHIFMYVGGLRFDTSFRDGPRGSRWQDTPRPTKGFTVRHYPGL